MGRISAYIVQIALCLGFVVLAGCSPMDDPDDPFTAVHHIESDILPQERWFGVERGFNLQLPPSYFEEPDQTYPVLIHVISNDEAVQLVRVTTRDLAAIGQILEMIVVSLHHSISNNADLEPKIEASDDGKAELYLDHLEREVLHLLASYYKVSDERILTGWSRLGQFATYALTQKPEVFSGLIVISNVGQMPPQYLQSQIQETFAQNPDLSASFYMAIGTEGNEATRHGTFDELRAFLRAAAPTELRWKADVIDGAGHSETFESGLRRGLLFQYSE